jgi:hypothetical protein
VKRRALYVAGSLLALTAAFLAGKYASPAKVVERIRVETKTVTVTEWKDRVVEKRVQGPVRVVEHITEKPGAERTITRWIDRGPVTTDTTRDGSGSSATKTDAKTDSSRTVTAQPSWRIEGQAGWSRLSPSPDLYGINISRRVVGTVWVGGWARTDKTAGASLGVEW